MRKDQLVKMLPVLIFTLLISTACSTAPDAQVAPPAAGLADKQLPVGGSRPVDVKTPADFNPKSGQTYPLLLLLHGYGSSAAQQDRYLGMSEVALKRGYVFAAPNGTVSGSSRRFWNASEACCNFEANTIDDVAYLRKLIEEITARYAIDPKRVYVFGHSNGGFMAYRLACDASPIVTAVAGLAGSLRSDPKSCKPERPVSVLAIHGTDDRVVSYRGGQFSKGGATYPSAEKTIARWAELNGCQPEAASSAPIKLLRLTRKPETTALRYSGCKDQVRTELWKLEGGSHIPMFTADFVPKVLDFFEGR
jgi:polyhydroxybutyrate depolymerase